MPGTSTTGRQLEATLRLCLRTLPDTSVQLTEVVYFGEKMLIILMHENLDSHPIPPMK